MATPDIDRILEKLVKDVELAVHALYRGEGRQNTQVARTGPLLHEARLALGAVGERDTSPPVLRAVTSTGPHALIPDRTRPATPDGRTPTIAMRPPDLTPTLAGPRLTVSTPLNVGAIPGWGTADRDAVVKCINAWLPMGGPASTDPDTKCIPAGKMLVPTWGERELAREAVRKITLG